MSSRESDRDIAATEPGAPVAAAASTVQVSATSGTEAAPSGRIAGRGREQGLELATVDPRRYNILRELARGGMGRISIAEDRALGRTVAIKEMLVDAAEHAVRFQRELALTARLQHPSIVSVHDGGVWPTGELVYIMRLVSGDSLEVRSARCRTTGERMALVPHAIAAVDALAYAHSQGIIHRDLKPANIMIGDFGETVVIDWGLAKDLRTTTVEQRSIPGPSGSQADTVVGDVIGTPAYMPAEQARGGEVDERADVYALGAVLYHVLSGAPPFRGRSVEVLAAVLDGPPPPLGQRAEGIPPDLLAIVARAMAPEPADRYPSAAELGTDLKRFQNGQLVATHNYTAWELARRWVRKRRAVVAVAAGALVALAIGGVISVRQIIHEEQLAREARALAEHHHEEAEQRRTDAEQLVDFMIFDLHDKLQAVGRLDVLDDVAQTMRGHYDRRSDARTPEDERKRAHARRNLGDILVGKGEPAAALQEYTVALSRLAALTGDDPDLALERASLSLAIGKVRQVTGEGGPARDAVRETVATAERMVSGGSADPRWRRLLAHAYIKLGEIVETEGDVSTALATYRKACAVVDQLVIVDPGEATQDLLSGCRSNVGDVLFAQGNRAAALVEFEAALAIDKVRSARSPDDVSRLRSLALGYLKVGDCHADNDNTEAALAMFRTALELGHTLTKRDPENTLWQRDLSTYYLRIGTVLATPATAKEALAAYQAANAIRHKLTAKDPSNVDWQRDLFTSSTKVGNLLEATDQLTAALTEYEVALRIAEKLAASRSVAARRDLIVAYSSMGRIQAARGDASGAMTWHRAELEIAESVLAGTDSLPRDHWALLFAHEEMGELLLRQHDRVGADAAYAKAQALAERRSLVEVEDPDWKTTAARLADLRATCCARRR